MTAKTLLVELGTEELPPKALSKLALSFRDNFAALIDNANISHGDILWFATPRRMAVKIINLDEQQPDTPVEKKGPSVKAAFNSDGTPNNVGLKWAQSNGISIDKADRISTPKGEWLVYRTVEHGAKTVSLIPGFVQEALSKLPVPKLMHWGSSNVLFVRPVHTLTMLFGSDVIPGEILGLQSGRTIKGHRYMGTPEFDLSSADEYPELLECKGMVIADYNRRKEMITAAIKSEADKIGGIADMDPDLIDEVTSLVEYPVLLTARFEEKFLKVPAEALVHTMKGDQKYFPVYRDGKLLPNFIFISNIQSLHPELVIAGNERVVRPRLSDAEFFFNTDKKQSLFSRFDSLKSVTYQKQLGSLAEKSEIVAELAAKIAQIIGANQANAKRAGILSKCDLVTNMVTEFTDTQGIMGMHYARIDGEPEEVAQALSDQYLPRFSGDELPNNPVSQALSIAEKVTTLTGIFGVNMIPKGDKDPYGLRRASIGLIRIAVEKSLNFDIKELVEYATELFGSKLTNPNTVNDVVDYVLARFKSFYQDMGVGTDVIQSVLSRRITNLLDFDKRIKAVQEFKNIPESNSLAEANKRVGNILSKAGTVSAFKTELMVNDEERTLSAAIDKVSTDVNSLFDKGDYKDALTHLSQIKKPVDDFFEKVMVNDENPEIRQNRLALLKRLSELFTHIADISLLQK
ncbi:glycine--tRNA ligase subunit beta [Succinimonas amylolytica]|uniref:glycine--tRNA ligase subunit beta n=1 Tax=Succinimonas amylolytica TaxID=83769 RepID=UPI00037F2B8D|nr:glycine--tRNA ligase subunit beta [Succinimonas amylolytica]